MIDRKALLADLQRWVKKFEDDLRTRCRETPALDASLRESYDAVKRAHRTAETYETWREGQLTQSAVGWTLACVFVRFLEDNGLLDRAFIGGADDRRTEAEHVRDEWFRQQPTLSDRDYLQFVFGEVGRLPGMADLFDRRHNALWRAGISGDAAGEFIAFWRKGEYGFADPEWDTRFLGDLYQDLSEAARKQYALLQTPDFIEEFILDRTLGPAIETFGYERVRMIDPTCGSGHFVLGGFRRLLALWRVGHPELNEREVAMKALAGVAGVDLNPFAVLITRFRLLLESWRFCEVTRLRDSPVFQVNIAIGDSLLHGRRFLTSEGKEVVGAQRTFGTEDAFRDELEHHYKDEEPEVLHRILGQQYHAVVGNPPYITVKDRALSECYRARYGSCSGKYSLSVPFMERFFDLAIKGDSRTREPAGYVGQITANSFMKREFGKKLIEVYLPRWDLTHVLDTSGAYIPGHGTPTVIILGRNQPTPRIVIRAVLGINGEPAAPTVPSKGLVWRAICQQVDQPGSISQWVSVSDSPSANFYKHPWSIGGGGAAELKVCLDEEAGKTVDTISSSVGYSAIIGDDDIYVAENAQIWIRKQILTGWKAFAVGDAVRDWSAEALPIALYPHGDRGEYSPIPNAECHFWIYRTQLRSGLFYGKTKEERGLNWRAYAIVVKDKLTRPEALMFASVATHNHFYFDRNGVVSNKSAPGIKLLANAGESDHLCLLGTLNSSVGCFWMKQVFHCKGSTVDQKGARQTTAAFENFYDYDGTKMRQFPVPPKLSQQLPISLATSSTILQSHAPASVLVDLILAENLYICESRAVAYDSASPALGEPCHPTLEIRLPFFQALATARTDWHETRRRMISFQEELDWQVYEAFGLLEPSDGLSLPEGQAQDAAVPIDLGQRAFEFVLARRKAAGEEQTTWFERHGAVPQTDLPVHWPPEYRALVERRITRIKDDANIRLIERPEYKRRWNTEPWDDQLHCAARDWLLARMETVFFEGERIREAGSGKRDTGCGMEESGVKPGAEGGSLGAESDSALLSGSRISHPASRIPHLSSFPAAGEPRLVSTRQLADAMAHDADFLRVAAVYRGREDFDLPGLVRALVEEESVPFLPALRYKESGWRKRVQWERTWDLQREEDRLDALRAAGETDVPTRPDIPVPPKYGSGDFKKTAYWRLRGKLDVPKERWIAYPGAERAADPAPVIAWAGWDHRQQAQALAGYYQERKDQDGWSPEQLVPLLAGLKDLLPWLKHWHNDLDPVYGLRLGDFYENFVRGETHVLGLSEAQVEATRTGEGGG